MKREQSLVITTNNLLANNVSIDNEKQNNTQIIKVIRNLAGEKHDEPTFARVKNCFLKNGIIEVDVLSKLLTNAPDYARGFIGISFHISGNNDKFECIYIRPTNGQANVQVRRNRAVQYISYPNFKFDKLRKEVPGKYESYADIDLNEWIHMKIEIRDAKAKLYLNDDKHPVLLVNDLKHGTISGGIGLWVDTGTEGYFKNLKITEFE